MTQHKLLINRELTLKDVPLITSYWQSLTSDDIKRMYIDLTKLNFGEELAMRLSKTVDTPPSERQYDPLIWEIDTQAVGVTNLNNIERGEQANIHLHIFSKLNRGKGFGRCLFMLSVQKYLVRHRLKRVICEPASSNPDPNGLMRSLGIPVVRTYVTKTPSPICFDHEVNRYEIDHTLMELVMDRLSEGTRK